MLKQTQRWTGPGGGTRRLHQIPCHSVAFYGDEIGSTDS